jgi:hypothetical protein
VFIKVIRKIFGKGIKYNALTKKAEMCQVVHLLKNAEIIRIREGEFVYSAGQPSNSGRYC